MIKTIAILGPEYSFSHLAGLKLFPEGKFLFCNRIEDIFKTITRADTTADETLGMVPLENMLQGTVRETLMSLLNYQVKIHKSCSVPIHHCLAAKSVGFTTIASHAQALAQCARFLEGKKTVEQVSTSKAMQAATEDNTLAAIGSREAAQYYGLTVLQDNIEDNHDNVTRFVVISAEPCPDKGARTSLMVHPKEDRPGLLFTILAPFATQGINLTKIESLPSGKKLGEYIFYIEIAGNSSELKVKSAIDFLKNSAEVYSFGSYDVVEM